MLNIFSYVLVGLITRSEQESQREKGEQGEISENGLDANCDDSNLYIYPCAAGLESLEDCMKDEDGYGDMNTSDLPDNDGIVGTD